MNEQTAELCIPSNQKARSLETLASLLDRGLSTSVTYTSEAQSIPLKVLAKDDGQSHEYHQEDFTTERMPELDQWTADAGIDTNWKPWFPVIDHDRCTDCMQCLSFCLFDVYGVSDKGGIDVRNEDKCKTDCPACSRVCPEVAIMFPKYRNGPINGEDVSGDDIRREQMKVDISSLLGGDIYQMLRDRSEKAKSRFSKERDDDKALKERKRCLTKLSQMGLDIPEEVLMSLPSIDEIQQKARIQAHKDD